MTETSGPERADGGSEQTYDGQDEPMYVSDDQLPEDLRPSEDNPLARPADEDEESTPRPPVVDGL